MQNDTPEHIGPYRLLKVLGKGGMGEVYLAEQEKPFKRQVALKLIKLGMDTKEVIARFESERQALALMNHVGIAKVFDAGSTEQGRPYFVMELVAGMSITTYCDHQRLPIEERLALFVQLCQAIQHAHQKGIIHRDIKPSNVLVTIEQDVAAPKVIDFGIAKAITDPLTDKTLATQQGVFIGTPDYMSPEQAVSSVDVDTMTDVYALGVLLYELLVGAVPVSLWASSHEERLRMIRENIPLRLVNRLSGFAKESQAAVVAWRSTTLRTLCRQVRGELNWIAQKALEKDRNRRYQSVAELAADVGRYLKKEAVSASPPSRTYQMRKFVARHKGLVAAVGLAIVSLGGVALRENIQGNRIAREAATAQQVSEFMVDMFKVSDPSVALGNTITAREILDNGVENIRQELQQQPIVQARLMDVMGVVYWTLGLSEQSGPLLERALKLRERELGSDHPEVALSLHNLGNMYRRQGKFSQAEPLLQRALAIREKALGPNHREVAGTLNNLALLYWVQGQHVQAEPLFLRSLAIREKIDSRWVSGSLNNLAILYNAQGKYAEAERFYLRSLAAGEEVWGLEHPEVAFPISNLAGLYVKQGRHVEAESFFLRALAIREKALGPENRILAGGLHGIATLYAKQGKTSQAESAFRRALAILEKSVEPDHPHLILTLGDYTDFLRSLGRNEEAEELDARVSIEEKDNRLED